MSGQVSIINYSYRCLSLYRNRHSLMYHYYRNLCICKYLYEKDCFSYICIYWFCNSIYSCKHSVRSMHWVQVDSRSLLKLIRHRFFPNQSVQVVEGFVKTNVIFFTLAQRNDYKIFCTLELTLLKIIYLSLFGTSKTDAILTRVTFR